MSSAHEHNFDKDVFLLTFMLDQPQASRVRIQFKKKRGGGGGFPS